MQVGYYVQSFQEIKSSRKKNSVRIIKIFPRSKHAMFRDCWIGMWVFESMFRSYTTCHEHFVTKMNIKDIIALNVHKKLYIYYLVKISEEFQTSRSWSQDWQATISFELSLSNASSTWICLVIDWLGKLSDESLRKSLLRPLSCCHRPGPDPKRIKKIY